MTQKVLIAASNELNALLFDADNKDDGWIDVSKGSIKKMIKGIKEAAGILQPGDKAKLTEETLTTLRGIDWNLDDYDEDEQKEVQKTLQDMGIWVNDTSGEEPEEEAEEEKPKKKKAAAKKEPAEEVEEPAEEEEKPKKKKAPAKKDSAKKRTKKAVVEEMINSKKGATIEDIALKIVDEGIDDDLEKTQKVVKLWLGKMGFDIKKAAIAKNPIFKA